MTPDLDRQRYLACLSDPSRFSLVRVLAGGPRCVTDLAGMVGLSQSCTTRHLQALLREGIVNGRRQGKRVVYSLGQAGGVLHPVLAWACAHPPAAAAGNGSEARRSRSRAGDSPGNAPQPVETVGVTSQLEPDFAILRAAVEHESGWVVGDGAAANGSTDLTGYSASEDAAESIGPADDSEAHPPVRSSFARRDLDDFLL